LRNPANKQENDRKFPAFHRLLTASTMIQTSPAVNWPVITRPTEAHVAMTILCTLSPTTQTQ